MKSVTILIIVILFSNFPYPAISQQIFKKYQNNQSIQNSGDTKKPSFQDLTNLTINPMLARSLLKDKLKYQVNGKLITEKPQQINNFNDGQLGEETLASFQLFHERSESSKRSRTPYNMISALNNMTGNDIPISTHATLAPAPNFQERPAIASIGDIYLVVWHDWRNQYRGTLTDGDIYATRIDTNGNILDTTGFVVCNAPNNQLLPVVASDGEDFLVVWIDARNPTPNFDEWDIYGARISKDGTVIDPNGFLIESKPNVNPSADHPPLQIARSDSNYMIVWEQAGVYDKVILGHILDDSGHPILSDPIPMPKNPANLISNQYQYPAVASNGELYFVGWCEWKVDHAMLRATRVSLTGVILDSSGITILDRSQSYTKRPKNTAISFLKDTVLVVFNNSTGFDVEGIRLDSDGNLIDSWPIYILNSNPCAVPIAITTNNNIWLVATEKRISYDYLITVVAVSSTGKILRTFNLFPSTSGISTRFWEAPAISNGENGFYIAWENYWAIGLANDIVGARISASGRLMDNDYNIVSMAPSEQLNPSIAHDGINYLVVWQDSRNAKINERGYDIYGARITSSGKVLDPDGIPICTAIRHQMVPKVAFNGTNYFVIWEDERELPSMGYSPLNRLYGTLVSKDGVVLNSEGFAIKPGDITDYPGGTFHQTNPDLAAGENFYFVVWQNGNWLPHGAGDIWGVRVSFNGELIDQNCIDLTQHGGWCDAEFPVAASNGKEFVVTWTDYRNTTIVPVADTTDIYAIHVNLDGQVLEPVGGVRANREKGLCAFPQMATDGSNWCFTWDQTKYSHFETFPFDVYGTILDSNFTHKTRVDIPISKLITNEEFPAVAWSGAIFTVAWTDDRNGNWDIYAARIDTNGTLFDKNGFAVTTASGLQIIPAIAAKDSNTLISWIDDRNFFETGSDIYCSILNVKSQEYKVISGNASYYSNAHAVKNVLMSLTGSINFLDTTDIYGNYEFLQVPFEGNYTLKPAKEDNFNQAISPFDASLILQQSVGLINLTPYQMIAGDVSGNGEVTPYDASLILRYCVGLIPKFPVMPDSNHFWTFVPESFPINETNWHSAPDSLRYEPLDSDKLNQDFVGIVYGNPSGNWSPSGAIAISWKNTSKSMMIRLGEAIRNQDKMISIPIEVEHTDELVSAGITIEYDPEVLKIIDVSTTELTPGYHIAYSSENGDLNLALAGTEPIGHGGVIANLVCQLFKSLMDGSYPISITKGGVNGNRCAIDFQPYNESLQSTIPKGFSLSQNYPNPFNPTTMIDYALPKKSHVIIKIFNLVGQKITTLVNKPQKAGYYSIQWDATNQASGIYFVQLKAGMFHKIIKITLVR